MNPIIKKTASLVLSLIFIFSAFASLPITTNANVSEIEIQIIDFPRGGGDARWGRPALNFMNGWNTTARSMYAALGAANQGMRVVYCVQPGIPINNSDRQPEITSTAFLAQYNNGVLNANQIQELLGRIFQYGYTGNVTTTMTNSQISEKIATQLLVWEVIVGERNADFSHNAPPANLDRVRDYIRSDHPLRTQIFDHFNRIRESVVNHSRIPSFMRHTSALALTHELTWDGSRYSVTLTDTAGVLSQFTFSSTTPGVTFNRSGNNLTISMNNPPSGTVNVSATRSQRRSALVFWSANPLHVRGSLQALVTVGQEITDSIPAFLNLRLSTGNLNIVKTTQHNNGNVAGFRFRVENVTTGRNLGIFTSGANGVINIPNLTVGRHRVTEIDIPIEFVHPTPNPVYVDVRAGQTATVNFDNVRKRGIITVQKYNSNPTMGGGSLAGTVFEIRNSGGTVVGTITTAANGRGQSQPLALGTYTVTERTAPYGFVRNPNTWTVSLTGALGTAAIVYAADITVPQQPQVGTITVTKLDQDTGTRAQGDATLNGAVFDIFSANEIRQYNGTIIFNRDQLVDTIHTGSNNTGTSRQLPLGRYYVIERTPPNGYTHDTSRHYVTLSYGDQNVAVVRESTEVHNRVIQGRVAIVKFTDPCPEGNQQIMTPLAGAIFEVYLTSAGSFENARPTERARITTDENGFAQTPLLPFGTYTVHEVYAPDDVRLVEPFQVFINQDGRTYHYILNNPIFTSLVRIVKVDSTTGRTIPAAGTSFRVWDVANNDWVRQSFNYPVPTTIDTFHTAECGTLVMPEALIRGDYRLYEVTAPWGYVLSPDPVPFTITSTQEDPVILEVRFANDPQMGIINIEKRGNMLTGATTTETKFGAQHSPIFSMTGLPGAVFNIVAAEDIITPDGTLRAARGTIVDTITTDSNGRASSRQLHLGNYYVIEVQAPNEFVIDSTPHSVSLVYAGQYVAVTSTEIGIENIRQMVEIELQKLMERPVNAPEGFNPYEDVIFGLFADEDIRAISGTIVIARGDLVSLIYVDENGRGSVSGELPFARYFVQELQTNYFYQLNPNRYSVVAEYQGQDAATAVVQVTRPGTAVPNETRLGRIRIEKSGEMLVGASELAGVFTPIWEIRGLSGVTFDIVASEDIFDGATRS